VVLYTGISRKEGRANARILAAELLRAPPLRADYCCGRGTSNSVRRLAQAHLYERFESVGAFVMQIGDL
jgi:hypothetical protein